MYNHVSNPSGFLFFVLHHETKARTSLRDREHRRRDKEMEREKAIRKLKWGQLSDIGFREEKKILGSRFIRQPQPCVASS